jgi:hypothetical protein
MTTEAFGRFATAYDWSIGEAANASVIHFVPQCQTSRLPELDQ